MRVAILWILLMIGCGGVDAAKKPKTYINHSKNGDVCWSDNVCVRVVVAIGNRYEGIHPLGLASSSQWITAILDAEGKVISKVKPGGDYVVISDRAFARRESGQTTYTLHRMDGSTKPVKTPYIAITPGYQRKGFSHWSGQRMGAIGTTSDPGTPSLFGSTVVKGEFAGIGFDGTINSKSADVAAVHAYGDYIVLAHTDGRSFSIADDEYRPLSPKLDNLALFTTDYNQSATGGDGHQAYLTRRLVFATRSVLPGGRPIYRLLPKRRGEAMPDGLLGLAPILSHGGAGIDCEPELGPMCRRDLRAWIAVWATDSGQPVVSIEEPLLYRIGSDRYRAVHWYPYDGTLNAAMVETLDGTFRVLPYQVTTVGNMVLSQTPDVYPTLAAATAALDAQMHQQAMDAWARWFADRKLAEARYAAWQAERDEEARLEAARAANERAEFDAAEALIASGDADHICKSSWEVTGFHARNNLMAACSRLRPPAQPESRGFWGDLAAGLAAYNRSAAPGSHSGAAATSLPTSSSSGDFNRSMQSIDSALRVIADPNWNGTAAAAQKY